jgi:hypothetical protein
MRRRSYLGLLAASATTVSGCGYLGWTATDDQPAYLGESTIVTERDALVLEIEPSPGRLGESVALTVRNTGTTDVTLGCNNPWALQRRVDGGWRHLTWTAGRFYNLCLTGLPPGESLGERFTLSESGLPDAASDLQRELAPGQYRLLLVGTEPYLATEFRVTAKA